MENLKNDIRCCFDKLLKMDGSLFECEVVDCSPYDERKLHEVCINHRLAKYFDEVILNNIGEDEFFVDIEFNREGGDDKTIESDGKYHRVRPDIIIHNRLSGQNKKNFLIVECKKKGAGKQQLKDDIEKIEKLMIDEKYQYNYGLQVIYSKDSVYGKFFYHEDGVIKNVSIENS